MLTIWYFFHHDWKAYLLHEMQLPCNLLVYFSIELLSSPPHITKHSSRTFLITASQSIIWMCPIYFNQSTIIRHLVNFQSFAINKAMTTVVPEMWYNCQPLFCTCTYCCCSVFPSGTSTTFILIRYRRQENVISHNNQLGIDSNGRGGNKTCIFNTTFWCSLVAPYDDTSCAEG